MTWKVEYSDELQIVVLTYVGETTGQDIKEAAVARIALGRQKGVTRYLIDTTKAQARNSVTFDIHDVPSKIFPAERVDRANRIAVIRPEQPVTRKLVKFYEDACMNRGWLVKVFQDRDSAVKWLQQKPFQRSPAGDSRTRADGTDPETLGE